MSERKVIQLLAQGGFLWALCDDGSIWAYLTQAREWRRAPDVPK